MQPGDIVGGQFRVVREAARGGMGIVYEGRDLERDVTVAIKTLRGASLDSAVAGGRFDREIALLASLEDPRIVRYVAHGRASDGGTYLVEEWVPGPSLGDRLDGEGFTPGEAAAVLAEVAGGLAIAHAAGIVHRDVKPENILFADGDLACVKIIDFGIARRTDDPWALTRTGTFVGTPGYISPEQARGQVALDPTSDVFALGCILYECLTGRPAFGGRSPTAVRAKVLVHEPPTVTAMGVRVPLELAALVRHLLQKDPALRPRDGAAVAALLRPFASLEGDRAISPFRTTVSEVVTIGAATRAEGEPFDTLETCDAGLVACVVIADGGDAPDIESARFAVARHGGQLEVLPGGTLLVTAGASLMPAEQVVKAASCALALRLLVGGAISLCGATGDDAPMIDAGVAALATDAAKKSIRVDRSFAALLRDAGFTIEQDAKGATFLVG